MRTYWLESETNVPLITSNSLPEYNSTHHDGHDGRDATQKIPEET